MCNTGFRIAVLKRCSKRFLTGRLGSMQAQAVELLCRCDDIPDEGVELRVLKGLLTAVTSNTLHVHGQALLLVRSAALVWLLLILYGLPYTQ